jgi:Pentapeptide repeats (8 copies)
MKLFELKNTRGELLWSGEADSIRDAVEKAVRSGARLVGANLEGANLAGARLVGANLYRVNLAGASLVGANLYRVNLAGANLYRVNLAGTSLVGANFKSARLGRANLEGANLAGASLVGANLEGADLEGANLEGANLAPIRDDFFEVLSAAPQEVQGLIAALREGRVDGSQYEGECACLVGTIANLRHEPHRELTIALKPDSTRTAEMWFLAIQEGDTPANNPVSRITVEWAEQWLREVRT